MRTIQFLKASLAAAALFSTMAAQASILNFDLTGGYNAHWQYDTDTTPSNFSLGHSVEFHQITGNFPGSDGTVEVDFYDALTSSGGLTIALPDRTVTLVDLSGSQLYAANTEDHPDFLTGTYTLTDFGGNANYVLAITDPAASDVPEPATAALLFGGLGLMFAATKRRQGR